MDLILYNAKIRTMDKQIPFASAVAVKDGIIIKVGTDEEILELKTEKTKLVDAEKKLVLPGFIDTHMHNIQTGVSDSSVMLFGSKSLDDVVNRVADFIKVNKVEEGAWVRGWGWNQDEFDVPKFPTREDLDKASKEHPIAISRACGHIVVCNTKALEVAGCLNNVPKIEGGQIDVDENGVATGVFREQASSFLKKHFALADKDKIKEYILMVAEGLLKQGITTIHTDDFMTFELPYETFIEAYSELAEQGELPVRVYQQCRLSNIDLLNDFIEKGYAKADFGSFFKLGPLKILGDGSLGARTAYLAEEYNDEPGTRGIPIMSQEQLNELVVTAHKAGMQVAVHAIGDGAMDMVITAIEKAQREFPRVDPRHGIIHCQITDMPLIERYRKLNLIAYVQPVFLDYDMHIVESRVGKEKASTSYAFNTMTEMGIHVSFGTDCPVERYDSLANLYHAVTRKDKKGFPEGGFYPEERMSVYDAVKAYTLNGAYDSYEEGIKGTISTGKYADMVIVSDDIFEIEPDKILDASILMTIVDGKVAYKA